MEVHRRGAQDGIERIAGNALQAVALQPVFRFEMSDAGLDRGATFHPSPQRPRRPASSSLIHMHRRSARVVVAAGFIENTNFKAIIWAAKAGFKIVGLRSRGASPALLEIILEV